MSAPDPPRASGAPGEPRPTRSTELSTDPGRSAPYESLYRGAAYRGPGDQPVHRVTARHFEPALTPPDQHPDPSDVYHWLFRPSPDGDAAATPSVEAPLAADAAVEDRVPPLVGSDDRATAHPSELRPAVQHRLLIALLVLLLLGAGTFLYAQQLRGRDLARGNGATVRLPSAPASPSAGAAIPSRTDGSTSASYAGSVSALAPTDVRADCRAASSTDAAGQPVRYDAALMADGKAATAWRCGGNSRGRSVTFTFPEGTQIAQLGLVNGYAKIDPATGADRYAEYRRIRQVSWRVGNGAPVVQDLQDRVETPQTIRVPAQSAERVTMTITRATAPGRQAKSRDAVLISEVTFAAPLR